MVESNNSFSKHSNPFKILNLGGRTAKTSYTCTRQLC